MNGIVHPYYTVALAPAIAAVIGIGATLLWRHRFDIPAVTALAGAVTASTILAAVLLARNDEWLPWLRAAVAVAGVGEDRVEGLAAEALVPLLTVRVVPQ